MDHSISLKKLCRLCRGKINLQKGYVTAKSIVDFKTEIQTLFCYDISNDKENVHPSLLCSKCVRQLRRINASNKLKPVVKQKNSTF